MTLRETLEELYPDEPIFILDGLDEAVLGIAETEGKICLVYGLEKLIKLFMERDGMDSEGASEFVDYNILNLYVPSSNMPIFVDSQFLNYIGDGDAGCKVGDRTGTEAGVLES